MNTVEPWMEEKLGKLIFNNSNMKIDFQVENIYSYEETNKQWTISKKSHFDYSKDNYILAKMADLYYKKGNYGKAYLCLYSIYGLKFYPHVQATKSIIELFDKPVKNSFEKFLLDKEKIKDQTEIIGILGTTLLAQNRLYEAEAVFSQIPDYERGVKVPFASQTFQTDLNDKSLDVYPQLAITKKVISLKNRIRTFSGNTAKAHLELGNYYFNTSYFGHAWKARDFFISIRKSKNLNHLLQHGDYGSGNYAGIRGNQEIEDISKAILHLKKAIQKGNKELKVEATFMLANCQQALYHQEKWQNYRNNIKQSVPEIHLKTYDKIEANFAGTEYYKMVIAQCEDYSAYVSK